MAYKPDIQYITQFYVPGSEARVVAPKQQLGQGQHRVPKYLKQEQIRVSVDPVALISFVTAVALIVTMAFSMAGYKAATEENAVIRDYVMDLEAENIQLTQKYESVLDLDKIYEQAIAMGMVPVSEVKTSQVSVTVPTPEPEPTLWENIFWFLEGLFA